MGGEQSQNARPKLKPGTSTPTLVKIANKLQTWGWTKRRESGDETPFCTKTGCQWK
jgi:hypothetical protein